MKTNQFERIHFLERIVLTLLLFWAANAASADPQYHIKSLGTLGGPGTGNSQWEAYATSINDSGQVVGESHQGGHGYRSFLYQHGAMVDLNVPYGDSDLGSRAVCISNSGQIVGYYDENWGYSYKDGAFRDLAAELKATGASVGNLIPGGVNSSGIIVGSWTNGNTGYGQAVEFLDTFITFPAPTKPASLYAVNELGDVGGQIDQRTEAPAWIGLADGQSITFGSQDTFVTGLNNVGDACVNSYPGLGGLYHAG